MKKFTLKKTVFMTLSCLILCSSNLLSQTQNYFGNSGSLNGSSWSTTPTGPYTSALVTTGGAIANFNTEIMTSPSLAADILLYGINVTHNVTFTRTNGIIRNYNNTGNMIIDVAAGKTFDCSAMTFSGVNVAGQTKNGEGTLVTAGGAFGGGFTLNAGTLVAKNTLAMGGNVVPGSLTINGGTIAADANRDFSGKFSTLNIGGDFTLGSAVSPATTASNLSFSANTSLGSVSRTITIGGTGIYTFSGVISGTSGVGISVNASAAGVLLFSNPANTYNGISLINPTAELRLNPTATTATFASPIDLAGGKLSTTNIASGTAIVSSSTLKLSDNSTLALGMNVHSLTFSDSHTVSWTAGKMLSITGWLGVKQASGTAGKIFVGVGGLSIDQLAQITFKGFSTGAQILSTGELVPAADLPPGEAYQHFIMYGQSLSVGFQSYPSLSVENVPGNYMIGNQVWVNNSNSDLNSFTPLVSTLCATDTKFKLNKELPKGECSITAMVNHLQKKIVNSGNLISSSCGTGGKSIEELSKECTVLYNKKNVSKINIPSPIDINLYYDFTTTINAGVTIAKMSNSNISCPAIVWMQGEWNYTLPAGSFGMDSLSKPTPDKTIYKTLLKSLKNNMQSDVMSKYNQTSKPLFITYQVGAQYTRGKDLPIGMAELEASNENEDIICAGPVYPVTDRGGHLDPNGYRWYGEMLAKAYYKTKVEGHRFLPLQPKVVSRTTDAKVIKIQFLVPKLPLVLDDKTLEKVPDYGFAVYNDNIKMVISSVVVQGDCVNIICTSNLSGAVEVTYAGLNTGILNGQGNLRDNDDYAAYYNYIDLDKKNLDDSYYYPRDTTTLRPTYEPKDSTGAVIYNKPYPLYNFCVGFYYKLDAGKQEFVVPMLAQNLTSDFTTKSEKSVCTIHQEGSFLCVNNNNEPILSFQLLDYSGKMVKVYSGNCTKFNIDNLNKGVYIARVKTNTSIHSLSLIIK